MNTPPAHFHYPILVHVERANGHTIDCSSNLNAPSLETFVLESERLEERFHSANETDSELAIETVRYEVTREFLQHFKTAIKKSSEPPEQLEPLYSITHGCLPKYLMGLEIHDMRVGMAAQLALAQSGMFRRKANEEITFSIHDDEVLEKMVLRKGYLIIPHKDHVIAYRYEDITKNSDPGIIFRLRDERWQTIDQAVAIRGKELASVISVHAPPKYDIARTIFPLFAQKFPHLDKNIQDNPYKGEDWEILEMNDEPVE